MSGIQAAIFVAFEAQRRQLRRLIDIGHRGYFG
jgi:hypothetical protein